MQIKAIIIIIIWISSSLQTLEDAVESLRGRRWQHTRATTTTIDLLLSQRSKSCPEILETRLHAVPSQREQRGWRCVCGNSLQGGIACRSIKVEGLADEEDNISPPWDIFFPAACLECSDRKLAYFEAKVSLLDTLPSELDTWIRVPTTPRDGGTLVELLILELFWTGFAGKDFCKAKHTYLLVWAVLRIMDR
jgi:hypothetical protein